MKLLKLGSISLDGIKICANASRHSTLSHGNIEKLETQLKGEVQELLALAEQVTSDQLVQLADHEMYKANRAGGNRYGLIAV